MVNEEEGGTGLQLLLGGATSRPSTRCWNQQQIQGSSNEASCSSSLRSQLSPEHKGPPNQAHRHRRIPLSQSWED